MILQGELEPGWRIVERSLCERFPVSRTPLREAFKVLAPRAWSNFLPNRGARVPTFGKITSTPWKSRAKPIREDVTEIRRRSRITKAVSGGTAAAQSSARLPIRAGKRAAS